MYLTLPHQRTGRTTHIPNYTYTNAPAKMTQLRVLVIIWTHKKKTQSKTSSTDELNHMRKPYHTRSSLCTYLFICDADQLPVANLRPGHMCYDANAIHIYRFYAFVTTESSSSAQCERHETRNCVHIIAFGPCGCLVAVSLPNTVVRKQHLSLVVLVRSKKYKTIPLCASLQN